MESTNKPTFRFPLIYGTGIHAAYAVYLTITVRGNSTVID